jgi:hypothetical protein
MGRKQAQSWQVKFAGLQLKHDDWAAFCGKRHGSTLANYGVNNR